MKARHLIIPILALCSNLLTAQDKTTRPTGSILFGNRDRLSGHAIKVDENNNLIWNSPVLRNEVPLRISEILEMSLRSPIGLKPKAGHIAKITLTNGDTAYGTLSVLNEEYVTLITDYAGTLNLKRGAVSRLEITESERGIYAGPHDMANWTVADGPQSAWQLYNGQLVSSGSASIAQEFELPEKAHISFSLDWRSSLKLSILMLSDDGETDKPENHYHFQLNRQNIYLRKRWEGGNGRGIGHSANIRALKEKENARFDFYVDRSTDTIALYIDDEQAQIWNDAEPDTNSFGNWIHFISEEGFPVKISNINISEWTSGELPDDSLLAEDDDLSPEEGERIFMKNGDTLIGEVGKITDGLLSVESEFTPINVPIERINNIDLTKEKSDPLYDEAIRRKGDIRAWFKSGGRITFRLDSFGDLTMHGSSQNFGEASFDINAFSRIEFNIYNQELNAKRRGDNW